MTGVEFILLLACVAILVLFAKVSNAKGTICELQNDVARMRDTPNAEKLIAEYRELGGTESVQLSIRTFGDKPQVYMRVGIGWGWYISMVEFDCKYVCPLRRQRLEKLDKKPRKKK